MTRLSALLIAIGLFGELVYGFINPIIPGFNPDPSIIRVGKDYFLATSSFEFFPGVPIYHSTDLIKWENIGHALNRPSQLNMRGTAPSGGIYAPTLRYHEGTFYLMTTWFDIISPPDNATRVPRSMYVKSDNIWDDDAWSDPTYCDQQGFDGDIFFDDDGKTYLTSTYSQFVETGDFSNWITQFDVANGNSLTESRLFHTTTVPLDQGYPLTEGSHLYKFNGTYYMMTADSGTGWDHKENMYRSNSLDGPWEGNPHNPLLWNGRNLSFPVLSTGHGDLVEGPDGKWWAVFLATRPQSPQNSSGYNQLGRETFLAPVTWGSDGWAIINGGNPITENMPGLLYDLPRPKKWRDDFDGNLTDKSYYCLRTPYKEFKDFTSRPGHLRLHGNIYTLSQRETPAAVLRKQVDLNVTFSTELTSFNPTSWRQEAGASIYLSIHYHDEIAVTVSNNTGKRAIVTRTASGPDASVNMTYWEDDDVAQGAPVTLYIKAKEDGYSLGYATGGKEPRYLAWVGNEWLQSYVAGWQNYVGSHFLIYNTGTSLPTLNPADFDYIQTELN